MRILTILTYYAPHWTGLTAHAVRVAEGLAARGHSVTVLTTRHSRDLARDEMRNGVRVVRLHPVAQLSRGMITPAFPIAAARLIAHHDVVQIHSPLPESLLVAWLCKAIGRPLMMTHHGDIVMPPGMVNQALQHIAFYLLRGTGLLADVVTTYSHDYAAHSRLLRSFPDLAAVYPPVEIGQPDPQGIAAWRAELGVQDKVLLGFAGRWVSEKGFDYLLRALPRIREAIPAAHLVYAGERKVVYEDFYAQCVPLIEQQAQHITFLGLLRDPQRIANFYGMCDLFVQPSRTDMMGLVQIEALLCGTPIVVSDIPGARVVVRETGYGRLAPPHDPPALADTIVDVLRNRARYQPDVARVRALFSPDRTLHAYETLMQRAVEAHETQRRASLPAAPPAIGSDLPVQRVPDGARRWHALGDADMVALDTLLANETDMAYRRRAPILLDYLELRNGARVLDGGCGMGFYLKLMGHLRHVKLVGVDSDPQRLARAQHAQVPATLLAGDVRNLPLPDSAFDSVLFSEVLEHLDDDMAALREAMRLLRPGGVLAISVPHHDYPFWWDPINRIVTTAGLPPLRRGPLGGIWKNHLRLYRPATLARRVEAAGFRVEALEEATHHCFPFSHLLLYDIGKPLLEHALLPASMRASADRFGSPASSTESLPNPVSIGRTLFRAIDRRNAHPALRHHRTFVSVLLKARKPE